MKDILDAHMHTIASGHAYSTIREMVRAASQKGLELVGITEHAPMMPGTCHEIYFHNFKVIQREAYEVPLLMGAELNITSYTGMVDLKDYVLAKIDYAVASLHEPCLRPGTIDQNTAAVIGAMQHPRVKIIGHPENGNYPLDYEAVAKAAKEHHVLLELNNSSYSPLSNRRNSRENAQIMLKYCRKYGVSVIMDSDAHIDLDVGNHTLAREVVAAADFPEDLIVNTDLEKFRYFLNWKG